MGQSPDGSTYREAPAEYILVQGNADLKDGWVFPRVWTTQKTKTAEAGDLIMSVRAPAGAMGKTAYSVVLGRGVAAIKGNEFIFQALVKMDSDGYWKKLAAGSTFESINSDTVSNAVISIPQQDDEQRKIGDLFESIDNLITLHQRKQNWQNSRFLRKISSLILAIAWEQCKFAEVYSFASEGGTPDTNTIAYYRNGTIPFVRIEDTENKYIDSVKTFVTEEGLKHSSAWLIPSGSVIFTNGATVGNVAINRIPVATKQGILGIIPNKTVMAEYLYYLLSSGFFQREVRNRQATGTFATIILKNLNEINVFVPDKAEQQKISGYLSSIDNLITLHQCEEILIHNEYGSSSLFRSQYKMANAWEQRKLGDLGKAQSGIGFPDKEQGGKTGIPFFKVSDMNNVGNELEMNRSNNYVSPDQIKKNGWSPIEETSMIFAKVGAAIMLNRKRLVRFPFLLDNNTMAYKFSDSWDIEFGRTLFERIDLTSLVQVGALPSYNAGDVENMEAAIPQMAEQYKLGALFKSLDNLITLHQCKRAAFVSRKSPSIFQFDKWRNTLTWEQRKCKELCSITTGKSNTQDQVEDGLYPFYIRSDMPVRSNKYLYDCEAVITIGDGQIGKVFHYVNGKFDLHQRCYKMADFVGIFGKYFFYYFSTKFYDRAIKMTAKATVDSVRMDMISEMDIQYPISSQEQRQIALFLERLDNLITLHQRGENIYNRRQTW